MKTVPLTASADDAWAMMRGHAMRVMEVAKEADATLRSALTGLEQEAGAP